MTIVALISPYRSIRGYARNIIGKDFVEVWVKASIEICRQMTSPTDVKSKLVQLCGK